MTTFRQETKYQWAKLERSGRTLKEMNALTKGAAVGLTHEYANKKEVADLESIQGGLERLTMTRLDAKNLAFKKYFKPKQGLPIGERRAEILASWLVTRKPKLIDWTRDRNLKRKGPPNKSQPGSSKNIPIGQTIITGEKELLQDWKRLLANWNQLSNADRKMMKGQLRKSIRSFSAKVR